MFVYTAIKKRYVLYLCCMYDESMLYCEGYEIRIVCMLRAMNRCSI